VLYVLLRGVLYTKSVTFVTNGVNY
jgi:hypothetical protein